MTGTNGVQEDEASSSSFELFVPGRLCLFGEHSDWAGGMKKLNPEIEQGCTIVAGINYGLYASVRPLTARVLRMRCTTDDGTVLTSELPLDEDTLAAEAQRGGFFAYCAGVAYIFTTEFHIGGLEIDNHTTTLPLKKGLSSSAALCVLVARAFNRAYFLGLTQRGEMQAAFEGERITPSQCGRMDQAVAFGAVPVTMTYSGDVLRVRPTQLAATLHLVLVDLRASKDTVKILAALQQAYPHPQTPEELALVELLGRINLDITARAEVALEVGDVAAIGALMVEAQAAFDARAGAVCPGQLGCEGSPKLHQVLSHPGIQEMIFGGKGVGSQGDGTAQLLCKSVEAQEEVCRVLEAEFGVHCLKVDLAATQNSGGQQNGRGCGQNGDAGVKRKQGGGEEGVEDLHGVVRLLERQLSRARLELASSTDRSTGHLI